MRWMSFCMAAALAAPAPCATRLKDLAGIEGVRDNQLIGYGLVVGLAGKGDTQQGGQQAFHFQQRFRRLAQIRFEQPYRGAFPPNLEGLCHSVTVVRFPRPAARWALALRVASPAAR